MKLPFLLLCCLCCLGVAFGQNGQPMIAGARGSAMGQSGVGLQDINSIFSNQAGLAGLQQSSVTAIGESRFAGFGVRSVGAAAALPTKTGTFGLALQYFGIEELNEQKVGVAFAKKLFDKLSVGIQLDYLRLQIKDYGSSDVFTFEAGLQSQISKKLVLGVYAYSPARVHIVDDEFLPTVFKLGGAFQVSEKLLVAAEVEKDIDFAASFHGGLEYAVVEALFLRAGVITNPNQICFGLGYRLQDQFRIDLSANYHEFLGVTPAFSVIYLWKKKQK